MRRGFTLLEVIVALALLAIVVSLIQGSYSGAARSRNLSRARTQEAHAAAVVLQRMADELSMAFEDPSRRNATGLLVGTGVDSTPSLAFSTRVPPVYGFSAGGDAEVGYLLETSESGLFVLARRQSADLDGDLEAGGDPFAMLAGIERFLVTCFDGDNWVEGWDSAAREDPPHLPLAVRIEVSWADPEADEEALPRVYRTATPVYAAREHP